jgi:predicted nucleotide-binding protein
VTAFIGSSSEGEGYARAIQDVITSLKGYAVLPWQSAFQEGDTYIESLIAAVGSVDAAVFVATPDDQRKMRNREDLVIRDNVLFEYGLFSGKIGRFRTALAVVGDAGLPHGFNGRYPHYFAGEQE